MSSSWPCSVRSDIASRYGRNELRSRIPRDSCHSQAKSARPGWAEMRYPGRPRITRTSQLTETRRRCPDLPDDVLAGRDPAAGPRSLLIEPR